jgi:hypothetical protein
MNVLIDLRHDKNFLVHLFAIDTPALLDDHHQAFAFRIRFGKIFAQIFERLAHPVRFVQTVVAKRGGKQRRRKQNGNQSCK